VGRLLNLGNILFRSRETFYFRFRVRHFEIPSPYDSMHCRRYPFSFAHDQKCTGSGEIQFSDVSFLQNASFHDFSAILAAILDKSMLHQTLFTPRQYLTPFRSYMTLNALGGNFTPPPLPGRVAKKTVAGMRVKNSFLKNNFIGCNDVSSYSACLQTFKL